MSYEGFPHPPYPSPPIKGGKKRERKGRVGVGVGEKKREKKYAPRVGERAKNAS
jgi:hypothetical protein